MVRFEQLRQMSDLRHELREVCSSSGADLRVCYFVLAQLFLNSQYIATATELRCQSTRAGFRVLRVALVDIRHDAWFHPLFGDSHAVPHLFIADGRTQRLNVRIPHRSIRARIQRGAASCGAGVHSNLASR